MYNHMLYEVVGGTAIQMFWQQSTVHSNSHYTTISNITTISNTQRFTVYSDFLYSGIPRILVYCRIQMLMVKKLRVFEVSDTFCIIY